MEFIQNLDSNILFWVQNNLHNSFLDRIMTLITYLGNLGTVWILLSIALILTKKYRIIGVLTFITLILNTILGDCILKHIVNRPRPFNMLKGLDIIINRPTSYSFPSGHTSSSFAAALMLGYYIRNYRWCFYITAILIALSRIYLLVHYPSDVFCGILLGCISFIIINTLYKKIYKDKAIKPFTY